MLIGFQFVDGSETNSGVYLVRNSDIGREMMEKWVQALSTDMDTSDHDDQGSFNETISSNVTYSKYIKLDKKQDFVNFMGHHHGGLA